MSLSTGMEYIGEEEWDACATSGREVNPFLLHAFLELAESSGCAVRDKGWLPQHVLVRNGVSGELLGCCPMYLKGHSYGEYVFDHRWALGRAGQSRAGQGGRVQTGRAGRAAVSLHVSVLSCKPCHWHQHLRHRQHAA